MEIILSAMSGCNYFVMDEIFGSFVRDCTGMMESGVGIIEFLHCYSTDSIFNFHNSHHTKVLVNQIAMMMVAMATANKPRTDNQTNKL